MPEIVTIGETMVSLAPGKSGFLRYADSFSPGVAGAESNVAVYASRFGHTSGWISRLGEDEFGYLIQNAVRAEGVDTSQVKFVEGGRTGVMFRQRMPPTLAGLQRKLSFIQRLLFSTEFNNDIFQRRNGVNAEL